jgi:hypothetical protein
MRAIFGIVGLLVVVAIVGVLAKRQLSAGVAPSTAGSGGAASAPAASPRQQVQQFEAAVQGTMLQARPMPDDEK